MGNNDSAKFTSKGWPSTSSTNGCCKQQTCLFAVHLFYVRKPTFTFYYCQMHCLQSFTYGSRSSPTFGRFVCITLSAPKIQEFFFQMDHVLSIITSHHARGPGFEYHSRHTRVIPRSFQLNKPIQPHTNHDQKTSMLTRHFIS